MDKRMYRYSTKKYNDSLLNMGVIRIGTLHDFRKKEHKKGISDPTEGTKHVLHNVGHISGSSSAELAQKHSHDVKALREFGVINIDQNTSIGNISISNVSMKKSFNEPDCFILCSSIYKSAKTMSLFEGADSCIEIKHIDKFYRILTNTLNAYTPVIFRGLHKVIYKDRQEKWNGNDWGHHPALIKEEEYQQQGEIRAIWQPKFKQPIKPMIICDYKLGSCVSYATI